MSKRKLTRREFLTLGGATGALLFTQACRLTRSATPAAESLTATGTATPTASASATPTVTSTATPGATATATAAATTATPTPAGVIEAGQTSPVSATDTPAPTPTPSPTPYPPGPPSKLGLFLTRNDSQALGLIERGKPPVVKTLELDPNFAKGIKELAPHTILIGRITLEQLNLDADPIPLARQFVEQLLPLAADPVRLAAFDAWEACNEPVADTPDKMKRLADYEAERVRLLAEHGLRSVVGNFATGHPPLELWPHFVPALAAARQYNGFLGLHEYSAPIMQYHAGALQPDNGPDEGDEGWLTLRYRKAYRNYLQPLGYGDLPLLITECGLDGMVSNRPGPEKAKGWQDFVQTWLDNGLRNDPPGVYMDQLIWYDTELQKDAYVKGATIFLAGASPGWESYDILGRTAELLQQYLEVHPQPTG